MILDKLNREIELRLNRETQYVLKLADSTLTVEGRDFLLKKIEDNDKTLKLIGEFIEGLDDAKVAIGLGYSGWEKFYRDNYWAKK